MFSLLLGLAITILSSIGMVEKQDYNYHQLYYQELKFIAEESASAGGQFYDLEAYSNGYKIFDKEESENAIRYIIQENMKLDRYMKPTGNNYWQDEIEIDIEFWDDTNLHELEGMDKIYSSGVTHVIINQPTVIVKINAGKPRYRTSYRTRDNLPDVVQIGAYSWEENK